jgi:hypothetical protein
LAFSEDAMADQMPEIERSQGIGFTDISEWMRRILKITRQTPENLLYMIILQKNAKLGKLRAGGTRRQETKSSQNRASPEAREIPCFHPATGIFPYLYTS